MPEGKSFELDEPPPVMEEVDQETLAAIEEGIRDAEAGRMVSSEEARARLSQWITKSTTPTEP